MADIWDIGKQYTDHAEQTTVAAIRARLPQGEGLKECEDCGDEIPAGRRKAYPGCTRCVECETEFEQFQKRQN